MLGTHLQSFNVTKAGWIRDPNPETKRLHVNAEAIAFFEGLAEERTITYAAEIIPDGPTLKMAFAVRKPRDSDNKRLARNLVRERFEDDVVQSMRLDLALARILRWNITYHCDESPVDFGLDYDLAKLLLPLAMDGSESLGRILAKNVMENIQIRPWDIASWCRVFFLNGIPYQPSVDHCSLHMLLRPQKLVKWRFDPLGGNNICETCFGSNDDDMPLMGATM